MMDFPVFDIHTHTYPEKISEKAVRNLSEFYNFHVEGKGTYEDLKESSCPFGVKGFLLFSVATNAKQVSHVNDFIAELAKQSRAQGMLTVGFASMHQDFENMEEELDRALSLGLKGVKIHPDIQGVDINDPRLMHLYAMMEERKMPLYLHMGDNRPQYRFSEAEKLLRVLDRFNGLTAVAAHLGGYMAWDRAECLCGVPNLYFDTSSALFALSPERASELILKFGTNKVMFGTDYPVTYAADELKRFFALPGLTEAQQRAILFDNAVRFLHI